MFDVQVDRATGRDEPHQEPIVTRRLRRLSTTAITASVVVVAGASPLQAQQAGAQPDTSGYIAANGVNYWFEIHGQGEPLLLLHGGLMSSSTWGPTLPALARHHRVIAVDLLGHGHTALGDRTAITLEDVGRDLAVVVKALGLKQVDAVGYSFGGGAALQLAFQHPELVRRLVVVSAPYDRNGFFAEMLPQQAAVGAGMADAMKETPMYQLYVREAPRPQDFPRLLDMLGVYMRTPYDWSAQVKQLAMPVLLVYGDSDMITPEHMISFYHLLGGGLMDAGWQREHMAKNRLAILPDVTHYEMGDAPALAPTVLGFLDNAGR